MATVERKIKGGVRCTYILPNVFGYGEKYDMSLAEFIQGEERNSDKGGGES